MSAAQILSLFCHEPWPEGLFQSTREYTNLARAMDRWLEVLPDIRERIQGARVIDFGCGGGFQAVAMAESGAASVLGVEIAPKAYQFAKQSAAASSASDKIQIVEKTPANYHADVITSQNSFEHFVDAPEILKEWKACLAEDGQVLVTFAPPWYSPWGAHMAYFCRLPWVQLFFPERVIMEVRSRYRSDGASTYREGGLARMSLSRFERLVQESGFKIVHSSYECSWGLNFLRKVPVLRELFVNRVTAVLKHREAAKA